MIGCPLDTVEVVGDRRIMTKLSTLMSNTSHPMVDALVALYGSFSQRLIRPQCVKETGCTTNCAPSEPQDNNSPKNTKIYVQLKLQQAITTVIHYVYR